MSFIAKELVQLIWTYSICNYISKKYSSNIKVPIIKLKISLFVIIIGFSFFLLDTLPTGYYQLLKLIILCSSMYCAYFTARLIVMVELKRKVLINEYLSTAILSYFWLFGIWFIQPRINQIYNEKY